MVHSYLKSFQVNYQGRSTRKEFWLIVLSDVFVFLKIAWVLYILADPSRLTYFPFLRPLFEVFYPYRKLLYRLAMFWTLARHAAIEALMVCRLRDAGKNPNWLYLPLYRIYLLLLPSKEAQKAKEKTKK